MLRRIFSLFGVGLLISPSLLHADTITTFALDGFTFQSPATLTGTITIDVTTGITTGIDATYSAGGLTDKFTVVRSDIDSVGGYPTIASNLSVPGNNLLQISLQTSSLFGYTGGPVCTYPIGQNCPAGIAWIESAFFTPMLEFNNIQAGRLDPVSTPTPEPSTFVLLASGLIGALFLTGSLRRKFCSWATF